MAREAGERPHSFAGVNSCADERMSCGEWAEDANPGLFRVSVIGKNISPHRKGKEHAREGGGKRREASAWHFTLLKFDGSCIEGVEFDRCTNLHLHSQCNAPSVRKDLRYSKQTEVVQYLPFAFANLLLGCLYFQREGEIEVYSYMR